MAYGYTESANENPIMTRQGDLNARDAIADLVYDPQPAGGGGSAVPAAPAGGFSPEIRPIADPGYSFREFKAPSYEEAMQEPGFNFRMQQGQNALERSAAARGLLRTGGTLKDITEYGQNFGAQEYQNVFNRAFEQAKLRSQQDDALNQIRAGNYRELVRQETSRALGAANNALAAWSKQGDWSRPTGGGGYSEPDPMPVWNEGSDVASNY